MAEVVAAKVLASATDAEKAEIEMPDWVALDQKATVAVSLAQQVVHLHRMEMAKVESDALGPEEEHEKQAVGLAWVYAEKAVGLYRTAETCLLSATADLKSSVKEMEVEFNEMTENDESQKENAKQLLKQLKEFKRQQNEKLQAVQEEIERIETALAPAREAFAPAFNEALNLSDQEETKTEDVKEGEEVQTEEASKSSKKKKKNKGK
eukprot:TRINITY_DN110964_c0_g1_i1.p1 TRINITY_DN110964_c0_g1~~TRINITY_DN110964_c0_g1_i1.p1  ORF type:complete len:208 (+),score=84.88 TRINITY_DN110964_c0_g1_i1:119-742(+)